MQIRQDKKYQLPHYTINESRSFDKNHNLKTICTKPKIFNTINYHLNNKMSMCDHYIKWLPNLKREKRQKTVLL